jgi:serine/threonine-protein kinase RsbW
MSADVVTLTIPARTEYLILARLALAGIAREAPIDQSTLADLKLAVTEACGNAVRHALPAAEGVVRVSYAVGDETIEIRVEDDGPGMPAADPREVAVEGLPESGIEELPESGMGLAIIGALVDEVEIGPGRGGRGTIVLMRRTLSGGAPRRG